MTDPDSLSDSWTIKINGNNLTLCFLTKQGIYVIAAQPCYVPLSFCKLCTLTHSILISELALVLLQYVKLQNPLLEIIMQTIFLHALVSTQCGSMGKWHKNLSPHRGKGAFFTHMVVYGELHRNHCCTNGSIRPITDPEKSRLETSLTVVSAQPGHSVSGQMIPFATQCPLEVSVPILNRRSMLRMRCKRWAPQPLLIVPL